MAIRTFQDKQPQIAASAYIDDLAVVIGDVSIGEHSSLWPFAVARGDVHSIRIGARTSIQDSSVLHVTHAGEISADGFPLLVGDDVTVGHRVILHGCTIGNQCLIGIGATVMDGAVVPDQTIIGAGALVPPRKQLEGGYLYVGAPVRRIRAVSEEELGQLIYAADHYVHLAEKYRGDGS